METSMDITMASNTATATSESEPLSYYTKGSTELAIETPVTVQRLEPVSLENKKKI